MQNENIKAKMIMIKLTIFSCHVSFLSPATCKRFSAPVKSTLIILIRKCEFCFYVCMLLGRIHDPFHYFSLADNATRSNNSVAYLLSGQPYNQQQH